MNQSDLLSTLGNMDIYLLDQVMKSRLKPGMHIFDAGCGMGRNLHFFAQAGYHIYGADISAEDIAHLQKTHTLPDHFRCEPLEQLSFPDDSFDAIFCMAVLHFARDRQHFSDMLSQLWRTLKPGGLFLARLASDIGLEQHVVSIGGRHFQLPDGSDRFLVNEAMLINETKRLQGHLIEPLKTTNVQHQRCMTTWVMQKPE